MTKSTIPPALELSAGGQDWPDEPSVVEVSLELQRSIQRARARYLRLGEGGWLTASSTEPKDEV